MELQIKSVSLPAGVVLPFAEQGDRTGLPVILLHGYTDSWRSFERVLPHMPRSLHVLAPSQRGHGDASRPAGGYRLEDFAGDLAAFMDALGLGRALIVGHSMGASVAQRFAIDHPSRVAGLALAGAFKSFRALPGAHALRSSVEHLRDPIDPGFALEFQQSTVAQPIDQAFLELMVAESCKVPARIWRAALAGLIAADLSAELGRIAAPTLLAWGDQDAIAPRNEQRALTAALSAPRLVTYRGVGHGPHWEVPVRVAADLANFAAEIERGAAAARTPLRRAKAA
jgi:pimeloyl-ACP methyl ester carboxylesterase